MGRVEETGEVTRAIEEGTISNFKRAFWTKASHEMSGAIQIEIAKSLAQLADDIHFIKEAMAKELEGEKSKSSGPTCLDCKYSDTMRYVDKDGIVNRDVEWCERKHQKINFDDKPVCDYFKPVEAEG